MVTTVPLAKFPLQLTATLPVAQLMLPPPTTSADRRYVVGVGGAGRLRKLAVTVLALVIVTVQTLALVESQPDQLPKVCVLLAVAMTLTTVFAARELRQLTVGPLVLPVRQTMLPPVPAVAFRL